jgi:hypothetical protein
MKYDKKNVREIFRFFLNFASLCVRYVHMIHFLRFNVCGFAATVCDWIMGLGWLHFEIVIVIVWISLVLGCFIHYASPMELVNEVLPIKVDGRIAVCEGGRKQSWILQTLRVLAQSHYCFFPSVAVVLIILNNCPTPTLLPWCFSCWSCPCPSDRVYLPWCRGT